MKNLITQQSIKRRLLASVGESQVQRAIVDYLTLKQIPHSITDASQSFNRNGQQVRRVKTGWPDLTACYAGHFLAIEVKRPIGGRLSPEQAATLHSLWQQGALIVVARSLDDVIALLETKQTPQTTLAEIMSGVPPSEVTRLPPLRGAARFYYSAAPSGLLEVGG